MKIKFSIVQTAIKILSILLPGLFMVACSNLPKAGGYLTCDFERNGDIIKIIVTNASKKTVNIHGLFETARGSVPYACYISVKLVDGNGIVITQNPHDKNGYWSWGYRRSTFYGPPFKTQELESGESIDGVFKLSEICQGLGRYSKYRALELDGKVKILPTDSVMVSVVFYLDASLGKWITFESDYLGETQKGAGRVTQEGWQKKGKRKIKRYEVNHPEPTKEDPN
ncbi:MAG: hypothetical protein LBM92_04650 [Opitutaceae bacterium]|jgi:hypothetical protein|nr:hypothetical protein [Opitutaceae bacterium]